MKIQIVSGIYTDQSGGFRTAYPRNYIPVPKQTGVNDGYLRPADGIVSVGTGPGADRGAIVWNGTQYRVMGSQLCSVSESGAVVEIGDVGGGGQVTMDYSFDRLGIASSDRLWYWDGATLTSVTDPDIGDVIDMKWIGGYFLTTDGTNLITTDLADPASVNVLHYGSAESDPDPVRAVDELRNEAYAFGRYTIEVFQNVGGTGFPFRRIDGAQIIKGILGTHTYCALGDTFIFLGSGRNEAPAVYQMVPGSVQKVSTREIDRLLHGYSDDELALVTMESRVDDNHQHVLLHLPDQTLVYDTMGSQVMEVPLWFTLDSGGILGPAKYCGRNAVWCYGRWNVADDQGRIGYLDPSIRGHHGSAVGWEFVTPIIYAEGNDAIVHDLELVSLSGRAAFGDDPTIWTSYTHDGQTWSRDVACKVGKLGERLKRIAWRTQGTIRHWRAQRFRGTSDAHLTVSRLEAQIEGLHIKA